MFYTSLNKWLSCKVLFLKSNIIPILLRNCFLKTPFYDIKVFYIKFWKRKLNFLIIKLIKYPFMSSTLSNKHNIHTYTHREKRWNHYPKEITVFSSNTCIWFIDWSIARLLFVFNFFAVSILNGHNSSTLSECNISFYTMLSQISENGFNLSLVLKRMLVSLIFPDQVSQKPNLFLLIWIIVECDMHTFEMNEKTLNSQWN